MKRIVCLVASLLIVLSVGAFFVSADSAPYWYPSDISSFENFHGENLPRVVDDAGVLTDEQEADLSAKVQSIVDKYGFGYVIFTDTDNHGLSMEQYSADFLYFNGYGMGDTYDAVVFYLSLEEGNRGWRTTSINRCEKIFTAWTTNAIDDIVDFYIRDEGDYYTAFDLHIQFVDYYMSLITSGAEWYPEGTVTYDIDRDLYEYGETLDLSKPRVVDNSGLFSAEQTKKLEKKLLELSKENECDIIIFTDDFVRAPSRLTFADNYTNDFYKFNGYYKDGVVFFLIDGRYGYHAFGKAVSSFSGLSVIDYISQYEDEEISVFAEETVDTFGFIVAHNRLPFSLKYIVSSASPSRIIISILVGLFVGFVAAGIRLHSLKKQMRVIQPVDARGYLVPGSFKLRDKSVDYMYTTVTKVAKPKNNSSSGGGGSSFSSGSSSSGGSYSSGGRNF